MKSSKDDLKPRRPKYRSRPSKTMSFSIDPHSQDKLTHILAVIRHKTGASYVSPATVIRRAIEALTVHYEKVLEEDSFEEELKELKSCAVPEDLGFGLERSVFITDDPVRSFYEKLHDGLTERLRETADTHISFLLERKSLEEIMEDYFE